MFTENDVALTSAKVDESVKRMEGLVSAVEEGIRGIDENAALYDNKKIALRKELRDNANGAISAHLRTIKAAHEELQANEKYFRSPDFLMSRHAVGGAGEIPLYQSMSDTALKLTFEDAKESGNLARAALAFQVASQKGIKGIDLTGVDFPVATRGLEALQKSERAVKYAESLFARAWGRKADPVNKMAFSRK